MWVWWEAPALEARVVFKPEPRLVSGQVKLCGDYSLASWESENKLIMLSVYNYVCLKSPKYYKTGNCKKTVCATTVLE